MSVKTETLEIKTNINDDISDVMVEKEQDIDNKLEELKAQMEAKRLAKKTTTASVKVKKSLDFGVVGTGQAGSRLAESFYKSGYKAVVCNTAPQDLEHINIPADNKLLLQHGIGGAAKELDIGFQAAENHREQIVNIIEDKLGSPHAYILCTSLGGGSGAGSSSTIIDLLSSTGRPVMVITILPMTTDDVKTKENAVQTLAKLAKLAQDRIISNIVVVDNAKLEVIYSNVSHMDFFRVGNEAIVSTLDAFNHFSAMSSQDKSLDPMELAKTLFDGEGLCVYGDMSVEGYDQDNTVIAQAVIENLDNGLFASGFNLEHTKYAGTIIVANSDVWKKVPRGSIDYAMAVIKEQCPSAEGVFRGTYVDDSIQEDVVKVYSMFSGLGLPDDRVAQLKKEVDIEKSKVKDRVKSRNVNLTLNTGTDTVVSQTEEIRNKIAKKASKFGQNFASGLDFRKK
jgi:cell division GTPase FtsZ